MKKKSDKKSIQIAVRCLPELFLLILLIAVTPCMGKIIEYPLDKMVEKSKMIVVGTVVKITDPTRKVNVMGFSYDEAVATIEIERIILGTYEEKQIDVPYLPRISIEHGFQIGERCVYFIGEWKERNVIVQGYGGAIPIDKADNVQVLYILGEQKRQLLKNFIQRIKDVKSKGDAPKDP
jgi:hypothetical protein